MRRTTLNSERKVTTFKAVVFLLMIVIGLDVAQNREARANTKVISLHSAVRAAQENDPWLVQNKHSQDAVEAMSIAAGTLPDPTLSFGLANFPTDTFDINDDARDVDDPSDKWVAHQRWIQPQTLEHQGPGSSGEDSGKRWAVMA